MTISKDSPAQGANLSSDEGKARDASKPHASMQLSERQRRELWLYITVSIVAVELLIAVGAVVYGFLGPAATASSLGFAFPWLSWGASALIAPALILLFAHLADVGLFRAPGGAASEQEWQKLLPQRMQKLYRIMKGAPVVVVLLGLVALGAAVMTIDGALTALSRFGSHLIPYIPHIAIGIGVLTCVIVIAVAWLNYRTRRLIAEYEFRRQVLEQTGVIIVDKGSAALPPGGYGDVPYALVSASDPGSQKALPPTTPDYDSSERSSPKD